MSTLTLERVHKVAEAPVQFVARPPMVVDATTVCAVLFNEAPALALGKRLSDYTLHAPYMLDSEVLDAVIKRYEGPGQEAAVAAVMAIYRELEIELNDIDVDTQADFALRYRLKVGHAAYLCLVSQLRAPVATFDAQLAQAARSHLAEMD